MGIPKRIVLTTALLLLLAAITIYLLQKPATRESASLKFIDAHTGLLVTNVSLFVLEVDNWHLSGLFGRHTPPTLIRLLARLGLGPTRPTDRQVLSSSGIEILKLRSGRRYETYLSCDGPKSIG